MKTNSVFLSFLAFFLFGLGQSLLIATQGLGAQTPALPVPLSKGWGEWRSLHTKHFSIHFPKNRREYAHKAARLFEKVHAEIASLYARPSFSKENWKHFKTNVSLIFSSDVTQAWATSLGINQIVLYLEPPQLGTFSRYESWLKLLFTHEYTHILSLHIWDFDRFFFLGLLRIILGIPPNFASPSSFIEGIAVWEESKEGLGRLEDPLTHMIVRTDIWGNGYPSLNEIINYRLFWSAGDTIYLYGGRFITELAKQAGEEAPRRYWALDSPPIAIRRRFALLGTELEKVYAEMRKGDLEYFGQELKELEEKGLSPYERLTSDGYKKSFLVYDEEGKQLVYYAAPRDVISGVFRISLEDSQRSTGNKAQHIRRQRRNRGIAWRKGKRFYSSEQILYPGLGIIHELHNGNQSYPFSRMAKGRSITYPSLSREGDFLYFIERKGKERLLKLATLQEGELGSEKILLGTKYDGILQYTTVSPNGSYLALLWRPGSKGFAKLVLCTLTKNKVQSCQVAAQAKAIITQPCFSQDNQELFFSSDVDGIYNLYALKIAPTLSSKKTWVHRLTRTATGLFYPAAGPDSLYAIAYFKEGYDIVRFHYKELLYEKVHYFNKGPQVPLESQRLSTMKGEIESEVKKSNGIEIKKQTQSPRIEEEALEPSLEIELKKKGWKEESYASFLNWLPYYTGFLDFGKKAPVPSFFLLGGLEARDPLEWHIAGFNLGIFRDQEPEEKPEKREEENQNSIPARFYYLYNRYTLGLSLSYLRDAKFSEITQAYLSYNSPGRFLSLQTLFGYREAKYFTYPEPQPLSRNHGLSKHYILSGPALIFSIRDTQFFDRSISPEKGWRLSAKAFYYTKQNSKRITSTHTGPMSTTEGEALDYSLGEGSLSLYLPSFFAYHVNYLSSYTYSYFGKNPEKGFFERGNLVRNLDPRASRGKSFVAYSYEYRFPIFWGKPYYYLSLRHLSLAPFYDYGIVKDTQGSSYKTWAYGIRLGFSSNILYFPLPKISLSISEGKNSRRLYRFFFSTSFPVSGWSESRKGDSLISRPYPLLLPQIEERPGYFYNR